MKLLSIQSDPPSDDRRDLELRNALAGELIVRHGSLTASTPTTCNRPTFCWPYLYPPPPVPVGGCQTGDYDIILMGQPAVGHCPDVCNAVDALQLDEHGFIFATGLPCMYVPNDGSLATFTRDGKTFSLQNVPNEEYPDDTPVYLITRLT